MEADNHSDLYPRFVRYCSVRCWISVNIQGNSLLRVIITYATYTRILIPEAGKHQRKSENLKSCNSVIYHKFHLSNNKKSAVLFSRCSNITSTMPPSFCVVSFSASLTNLTPLLPQSHNCSCYVSRRTLARPPL